MVFPEKAMYINPSPIVKRGFIKKKTARKIENLIETVYSSILAA